MQPLGLRAFQHVLWLMQASAEGSVPQQTRKTPPTAQ